MIDLHVHSNHSDGLLTPSELVERAKVLGITALALTDHDTGSGNAEALQAGERFGVEVIAGIELSANCLGVEVHILGFGVDRCDEAIDATLKELRESRDKRLTVIISRLNDLGVPISSEEVRREAAGGVIGRLHIARALHRRRAVGSVREAFALYLGRGGRAFAERKKLESGAAIDLIRRMGGVAVLAHPGSVERENPLSLPAILEKLIGEGLTGIETQYTSHNHDQIARYAQFARESGLLETGGSDFHRPDPDGPRMGTGTGRVKVTGEMLERLTEAIAKRRGNQAES